MRFMLLLLLLSGCAPFLAAKEARDMTPEQIKAYSEQGMDVYQCLNISGPPPSGGVTLLIIPREAKAEIAFGNNCQLLVGKVIP